MNIIDDLRKATKEKHDQLDQLGPLSKINSNEVRLEDYESYLRLFYGIHFCIEPTISYKLNEEFDFEPRLSSLYTELEKLDLSKKVLLPDDPLQLRNDEILGSLYVLEGSKLGGKMIIKNLRNNLPLEDYNYLFLDYKSDYSWKDTLDFIKENSEGKKSETISGAIKTFDFILSYVNQFYEKENSQNK